MGNQIRETLTKNIRTNLHTKMDEKDIKPFVTKFNNGDFGKDKEGRDYINVYYGFEATDETGQKELLEDIVGEVLRLAISSKDGCVYAQTIIFDNGIDYFGIDKEYLQKANDREFELPINICMEEGFGTE